MRTAEERIASLHTRMADRRQRRERRTTRRLYAACAAPALCLTALIICGGAAHPGGTAGVYTGAAMLFTGAGPYVLTAVVAFMLGVAVTALLKRKQNKQRTEEENG